MVTDNIDISRMDVSKLAFIGDSVYELIVRKMIVERLNKSPIGDINLIKVKNVCCEAQANFFKLLEPFLSDKEMTIYKRGRNSGVGNVPSRVRPYIYKVATGVETLIGYLYLSEKSDRIYELFSHIELIGL